MKIKLIVGLANPGLEYTATRHNAGSWYVELLAKRQQKMLKKENKFYGYTGRISFGDKDVLLLVPTTFMNLSGKAVAAMANYYHIAPEEILVAHDELDLLPGNIRFKFGGGRSSHNSIKNIIIYLGNNALFNRLRIGIGHPGDKNKVMNFVLNPPSKAELQLIYNVINEAVFCTEILITQNTEKAMNRLHSYRPY